MTHTTLILGSNSPRRKQLLALGGADFTTSPADIDETPLDGETARDYVLRLAEEKARTSGQNAAPGQMVIGSDTTVVVDGEILGKPADDAEAVAMLERLRGRTHQVYTGIALFLPATGSVSTDICITDVPMRAYSDEEIRAYVATGDPLDKAGAYAVQHPQFQPVIDLKGCRASVMGLPLCHVARLLKKEGLHLSSEIARKCQQFLSYECDVYKDIE